MSKHTQDYLNFLEYYDAISAMFTVEKKSLNISAIVKGYLKNVLKMIELISVKTPVVHSTLDKFMLPWR